MNSSPRKHEGVGEPPGFADAFVLNHWKIF